MTFERTDFMRQRRSLIVVSILVAFINISAGNITKLNLLGNEIKITNPSVIPLCLLLTLSYFLIRYFQYMHEIDDKGLEKRFVEKLKAYLLPTIKKKVTSDPSFRREQRILPNCGLDSPDEFSIMHLTLKFSSVHRIICSFTAIGDETKVSSRAENTLVSLSEFFLPLVKSSLYVCFRTPLFSDYVLPLLFATFSYMSYSSWFSNLFKF